MLERPVWIHKFQLKPNQWVFVPDEHSKKVGLEIKNLIQSYWNPPAYFYHLVSGGHVAALKAHSSNTVFFRLDIQNFFGCVGLSRVTREVKNLLRDYGLGREIAKASCVHVPGSQEGWHCLPFGFVQSPIIASLCLHKSRLGQTVEQLILGGFTVSVYMDDIVVSHPTSMQMARTAFDQVINSATAAKFPLNEDKTTPPSTSVTAFNIQVTHASLKLTDVRMARFRTQLATTLSEPKKAGILNYVESVNKAQALALG